jgi:hypothetical protein
MSQFHFVGEDVTRLKALAEKAALNVAFKIQAGKDDIDRQRGKIVDIKRYTWFGLGWFNSEIADCEHEIGSIEWRQNGRRATKFKLDELAAQLDLNPTNITLDADHARLVRYWAVDFDECSASS